eukprot:COSAG01_NODE_5360_length_4308_cov_31.574210_1_plen_268_part_00
MAQQPEPEPELKLSPASSSPPPPPPGRDWFSSLFGFSEAEESVIKYGLARPAVAPHANVWRHLELIRGGGGAGGGQRLRSRVNGMEYGVGEFGCPSLRELREDMGVVKALSAAAAAAATCCGAAGTAAAVKGRATTGALTLHVDTGVDAAALHGAFRNAGATFQVASQFNCLEFPGPSTTPEDGVTNYAHDRTQVSNGGHWGAVLAVCYRMSMGLAPTACLINTRFECRGPRARSRLVPPQSFATTSWKGPSRWGCRRGSGGRRAKP